MTRRLSLFTIAVLFEALAVRAWAQARRISPRGFVEGPFGSGLLQITYGRPYRRNRKLFGSLIPYKQLWRTGADEATALATTVELTIGSLTVPPGEYSLLTIPEKDHWTLIVNREPDLRGTFQYNRKKDLGRVEMKVEQIPELVEQLTISVPKNTENSGVLTITWENTQASVPISAN